MNRRQILKLSGSALVATAIAGCSSNTNPDGTRRVSMNEDFAFDPKTLTVSAGTTVRWVNDSDVGHTVTAYEDRIPTQAVYFASGGFESERSARNDVSGGLLATGDTYEHTFDITGTYEYVCIPHESSGMTGTVAVE
ncbi:MULTISPECIES: plastocyanin/azurin family copper-binding protein [unclassified Haloferax]|uniref:plastocyanin/azurin family copper-binding protein n=1 Tax=unclassified Haloferax TaxID=2625095 RepID=UPI002875C6A6|nr:MULTISPECIES: plastocyanin/azurin family copper-binding protein [unclassified Haloferax]MDS0243889.1 plastocyanin/azurin family copper-binding protein [Haloferax sp. S2CR25]MDS0447010.1 plastocyanin/azurin family copper-binding protein [Haloferax sp. S2CR25-2]